LGKVVWKAAQFPAKGIWTGVDPDELMFNLRENLLEREERNQ
jgi:hypothetical protein